MLLMFHEPVLYHKLYIKNAFYLFQHVFVLDHASIVLFPNKKNIIIIIITPVLGEDIFSLKIQFGIRWYLY